MEGFKIHNFDFNKLMAFAETAKGDVFLKTADGDVLNLKSKLTQLLALSKAIDWGNVGEAEVISKNQEERPVCSVSTCTGTRNKRTSNPPGPDFPGPVFLWEGSGCRMDEELSLSVYRLVEAIPEGKVLTYGEIAALLGRPRNARLVGRILSKPRRGGKRPAIGWSTPVGRPLPAGRSAELCAGKGCFSPGRRVVRNAPAGGHGKTLAVVLEKIPEIPKNSKKALAFLKEL